MGLPDSQNATYAASFVLAGISWLVGIFIIIDVVISRVLNSRVVHSRVLISHKLYLSWYLYLLGAAAITFAFMHLFWDSGDNIRGIHTVGCICLGAAAFTWILVGANFIFAERNSADKVIVEAQHRTTDELIPLADPAEPIDETLYRRVQRAALPHEIAPDDPENPTAFRWIIGPLAAHLPFTPIAVLLFIAHTIAAIVITNDRAREVVAMAVWLLGSALIVTAVIVKLACGRASGWRQIGVDVEGVRDTSSGEDSATDKQLRYVHAAVLGVVGLLHMAAPIIALIFARPCDDDPMRDSCGLDGAFTYRALVFVIACVGSALLSLLPLWSACTSPATGKVADADTALPLGDSTFGGTFSTSQGRTVPPLR